MEDLHTSVPGIGDIDFAILPDGDANRFIQFAKFETHATKLCAIGAGLSKTTTRCLPVSVT